MFHTYLEPRQFKNKICLRVSSFWNYRLFPSPTQCVKKGGNFKMSLLLFLNCLGSSKTYVFENSFTVYFISWFCALIWKNSFLADSSSKTDSSSGKCIFCSSKGSGDVCPKRVYKSPETHTYVLNEFLTAQNSFEKTVIEVRSSYLYASFDTFYVQIDQLFEARWDFKLFHLKTAILPFFK